MKKKSLIKPIKVCNCGVCYLGDVLGVDVGNVWPKMVKNHSVELGICYLGDVLGVGIGNHAPGGSRLSIQKNETCPDQKRHKTDQ